MARLKCACGTWVDIDEMVGHRKSPEHARKMTPRRPFRMAYETEAAQTRTLKVPVVRHG